MQANWIGRSEGAEVDFELIPAEGKDDGQTITVFTTRPDTLFGCSFFLLAPESPLVHDLVCGTEYEAEVMALVEGAAKSMVPSPVATLSIPLTAKRFPYGLPTTSLPITAPVP